MYQSEYFSVTKVAKSRKPAQHLHKEYK